MKHESIIMACHLLSNGPMRGGYMPVIHEGSESGDGNISVQLSLLLSSVGLNSVSETVEQRLLPEESRGVSAAFQYPPSTVIPRVFILVPCPAFRGVAPQTLAVRAHHHTLSTFDY